jgi:hypothetical protein
MMDEKVLEVSTSRTFERKELTRSRFHRYLNAELSIHKVDNVGLEKDL